MKTPMGTGVPARISALPVDPQRGLPVPWFVAWIDGKPDFRVIGENKIADSVRFNRCWICGQERGRWSSFVIGPMCAVTRTNSEPPSHNDCAIYAAITCPFLTRPGMRRREAGLPEGYQEAAGCPISRNPGAVAVWSTRSWKLFPDQNGRALVQMGDPESVLWFAEGRPATRAEITTSIETGLPYLPEMAEPEGPRALAELDRMVAATMHLLPEA